VIRNRTSTVQPNLATMPPLKNFKKLDVRPLLNAGQEPLSEIRRHLGLLKADEGLIVIAPFLPSPLIERLGAEGFASKIERGEGSAWIVYFWREVV
jgi:hypothetical protein